MIPSIEIHIITYNEQVMLPFTIAHYKRMFDNPVIHIHDNYSTDSTPIIAIANGCHIKSFITNGMNDTEHRLLKSKAVLEAKSDWCLVIDCDEECMINSQDLENLEQQEINAVHFDGYDIFDKQESPWEAAKMPHGCGSPGYSKPILFKVKDIKEIEFGPGAHKVEKLIPIEGKQINWSNKEFKLLHYKHWSPEWHLNRSHELASRQSVENLRNGHSTHFALPDSVHTQWFNDHYAVSFSIEDKHI